MAQPPVPSTVKEVTIKPRLWGDAAVGAPGVGPTTPGAQKTQCLGVKKRRKMMRCIVFLMVLWTIICNIYIYFVYIYYIYIYIYIWVLKCMMLRVDVFVFFYVFLVCCKGRLSWNKQCNRNNSQLVPPFIRVSTVFFSDVFLLQKWRLRNRAGSSSHTSTKPLVIFCVVYLQ